MINWRPSFLFALVLHGRSAGSCRSTRKVQASLSAPCMCLVKVSAKIEGGRCRGAQPRPTQRRLRDPASLYYVYVVF